MTPDDLFTLAAAFAAVASVLAATYVATSLCVAYRLVRHSSADACSHHGLPLPFTAVAFPARDRAAVIAALYGAVDEPRGAVVLVHGRGGSKDHALWQRLMSLVERLLELRLAVLIIDLRGHGASTPARLTFGVNERNDVLGAVDWLRQQGFQAGRIAAIGASMGGAAVIAAAAEEPAIGAVISDSAFAEFRCVALHAIRRVLPAPVARLVGRASLRMAAWICGAPIDRFAPARLVRDLRQPLLVVHARGDPVVPAQHALALAAAGGTQAWITSGSGHVSSFLEFPDEYLARLQAFLASSICGDGYPRQERKSDTHPEPYPSSRL